MHWIYLIHEFHILSWITKLNELFHDILIYWDAPVDINTQYKLLNDSVKQSNVFLNHFLKMSCTIKNTYSGYLEHVNEYAETQKEEAVMARNLSYLKIPGYLL